MYDKTTTLLNKSAKDVNAMEEKLFLSNKLEKELLESLTIKKRNIVGLKHLFMPHKEILEEFQEIIPKFYKEDLDVYFEDLVSRLDRIMNVIENSYENVESLFETYNSLMTIKTNSVINILTIFTAIT
jgi:magnesium transporter